MNAATRQAPAQYELATLIKRANANLLQRPNSSKDLRVRADAFYLLKQYEQARRDYEHLLELKPDSPQLLYRLGCVCELMRRRDAAVEAFERFLVLRPESEEAALKVQQLRAMGGAALDSNRLCELMLKTEQSAPEGRETAEKQPERLYKRY